MSSTPSNYMNSKDYYKDHLASKIDQTYEFSSDTELIKIEDSFGTLKFTDVLCRVTHAINPKTGKLLGDDFKDLKFFNLDFRVGMGYRFEFSDSVWITINTDNYKYVTKSCIVGRCNNVLNYIDKDGVIISEPCIIDYDLVYSNVYRNDPVNVPQGTTDIIVQYNENTKKIRYNDRFILGSLAYKVKSIMDYQRTKTFDKESAAIINFKVEVDVDFRDDNHVIDVANMDEYKEVYPVISNGISVEPRLEGILQGEEQIFSCYMYSDGIKQDDEFNFSNHGVPYGYYFFEVIDKNHFKIINNKAYLKNKLRILCDNGVESKEFMISLRGDF